jgi:hypothetical protein
MAIKFIADSNVGKLARGLRMIGYDTLFFRDIDDGQLIKLALKEGRILLTKDTQIVKRRLVSEGKLKAILIQDDDYHLQLQQVVDEVKLDCQSHRFTLCLECNQTLIPRTKEEVKGLVPPYVFRTQGQYMQCPSCHRIYWRGTHWQRMNQELEKVKNAVASQ